MQHSNHLACLANRLFANRNVFCFLFFWVLFFPLWVPKDQVDGTFLECEFSSWGMYVHNTPHTYTITHFILCMQKTIMLAWPSRQGNFECMPSLWIWLHEISISKTVHHHFWPGLIPDLTRPDPTLKFGWLCTNYVIRIRYSFFVVYFHTSQDRTIPLHTMPVQIQHSWTPRFFLFVLISSRSEVEQQIAKLLVVDCCCSLCSVSYFLIP